MNHGAVIFAGSVESRVWDMAMDRQQFVALYTDVGNPEEVWRSAFVRSVGEPPLSWFVSDEVRRKELESDLQSASPRFRHPTGEYGRYDVDVLSCWLSAARGCVHFP